DDLIAPAMREFRQRHPKARVSLFELSPRAQLDRLRTHELDAAILGNIEAADRQIFAVRCLSRHRMAAVLPDDHPLAARKTVKISALEHERWISLSDALFPGRRDFLRGICAMAGFEPQILSEVDSLSLLLGAVSTGDGVAILPEHSRKLPHTGCVFVKLAAPVPMSELLLVQPKRQAGREMATLAELIAERAGKAVV
ncbi:MAG: LysR family substrate-binding domain-containing protein, partial [Roseimicrobium sp.]